MENEIRMYAEADFERSRSEKRGMIRRMLLCALPFLAGAAAAFAVRHEPLCIACMIAFGASLVFLYDLWVKPAVRYDRLLAQVREGSSHDTLGTLVRISEDLTHEEGVNFREVIINVYEDMDEEGERRFLLDERREIPREWLMRDVVINSYGSTILGVRLHGGEVNV